MFRVRNQRGDRRPRGERPVRVDERRRHDRVGTEPLAVVGVFEADGGVAETEIWADVRALQGAYRRGNTYQSVLAQLESTTRSTRFATGSPPIRR